MSATATACRQAVVDRVLNGPGVSDPSARRAAFDNRAVDSRASALIDTVARNAWKVTDAQVAETLAAGLSEDAVFELTVCAALGQAARQMASALAVLDEALAETSPAGATR